MASRSAPANVQETFASEPVMHYLVDVGQTVHVDACHRFFSRLQTKLKL